MKIEKIIHKNEARIKVGFSYNREFIALIKQIPGALWSKTLKSWHLPYTSESYELLKKLFVNHLTNEIELEESCTNQPLISENKQSEIKPIGEKVEV